MTRTNAALHLCPDDVHAMPPVIVGEAKVPAACAWATGEDTLLRKIVEHWDHERPLRAELLEHHDVTHYCDFVMTGEVHALRAQTENSFGQRHEYYKHGVNHHKCHFDPQLTVRAMDFAHTLVQQLLLADYVSDDAYKQALITQCMPRPVDYVDVFFGFLLDLELCKLSRASMRIVRATLHPRTGEAKLLGKTCKYFCEYVGKAYLDNRDAIVERYGVELVESRMFALYCEATRQCSKIL